MISRFIFRLRVCYARKKNLISDNNKKNLISDNNVIDTVSEVSYTISSGNIGKAIPL